MGLERNSKVLYKALKETGMTLKDGRSKQSSRPRKISVEKRNAVIEHISSFERRKGYYNCLLYTSRCV